MELILATAGGLLFNLLGIRLPELATLTLGRIGSAALPIGLMAVGAGLRLGALRESVQAFAPEVASLGERRSDRDARRGTAPEATPLVP